MTWTKLSDDYADECWTLSNEAFRLYAEALVWSNRKLLDGRIPFDDLPRLSKCASAAPELTACGWWSRDDEAEVFILRYHLCYQRTREQVMKQQEANKANGARGGRRRGPGRERLDTQSVSESVSESLGERDGTGRDRISHLSATQGERSTTPREEELHARTRASDCAECQRRQVFRTGPCPDHRERTSA